MKSYYYNIDFLRFLACISILIFHAPLTGFFPAGISGTSIGVTFFFILAVFFTYFQVQRNISGEEFVIKKCIRLWPVIIASYVILAIQHYLGFITQCPQIKVILWTLAFIRDTGLTKYLNSSIDNAYLWFIGPMVCACGFYFCLFKGATDGWKGNAKLVGLIIIFLSSTCYMHSPPLISQLALIGTSRALSGVGIGYFLAHFCEFIQRKEIMHSHTTLRKISFTMLELLSLYYFIDILFLHYLCKPGPYIECDALYILAFIPLIALFYCQKGYVSCLLNRRWLGILGAYSFSIYVFQYNVQVLFFKNNILYNTKWYEACKEEHMWMSFVVFAIIIPVIVGGLIYYIVERPSVKFLTQMRKNRERKPPMLSSDAS